MNNIPISESVFSEEFRNVASTEIALLSKENALSVWKEYVDDKSASYFSLPDDSWVVNSGKICVGQWIQDYNDNESEEIEILLEFAISWNNDDIIWFCISKYFIIESSWRDFRKYWRSFLECNDDCPIIIDRRHVGDVIIFTPIGDILKSN